MKLLLALLLLIGCKARAPKLELECTFDQDCTLESLGADCCDSCEAHVGNIGSMAAFNAWCVSQVPASCPDFKCTHQASTAMCEGGRCVAKVGIH